MSVNTTHISEAQPDSLDHRAVGLGAVAVGFVSLAFANFVTPGDQGGPTEFAVIGALMLAVAVIVFDRVVPTALEAGRPVRTALILTAVSVLGGMFFWAGIAQVTAPAAVLLGYAALQRDGASRTGAWAAVVLSSLLYVATLVACVIG